MVYSCPLDNPILTLTGGIDASEFARRLWGDIYYNTESKKFVRKSGDNTKRTFLHFILEPLYKIYSHVLGEESDELRKTLDSVGLKFKKSWVEMDMKPLLKLVCQAFFGPVSGFVSMLVDHIPSPVEGALCKVNSISLLTIKY